MQEYRCVRAQTLPYVGTHLQLAIGDYKYLQGKASIPHDYRHLHT